MKLAFKRWDTTQRATSTDGSTTRLTIDRMIMLHGLGGTGSLWRPLAIELESDFDILAPDQRGHGGSQIPQLAMNRTKPRYSPVEYGADVVELMQDTAFHPAWVLGHSMGVRSACAVAHLKPEWVKGLVLIDIGFAGAAGGGLGMDLANFLRTIEMRYPSRQAARTAFEKDCPDPSIAQYLLAVSQRTGVTTSEGEEITFPFDRAALIQTIEAARDTDLRHWVEAFGRQSLPVLVLRGAQSKVWSAQDFEGEKNRFASFSTIRFETIEGAGHGLPFEKRKELASLLRSWTGRS